MVHGFKGGEGFGFLKSKAVWVRIETLKVHAHAQETRIASSLSSVEIFTALYSGGLLKSRPQDPAWTGRDRLIVSKGHGAVSLYPILADLGFFDMEELGRVCKKGSFLGGIPDPVVPGFETVNGSPPPPPPPGGAGGRGPHRKGGGEEGVGGRGGGGAEGGGG